MFGLAGTGETSGPNRRFSERRGNFYGGFDEKHHEGRRRGSSGRWHWHRSHGARKCGCACRHRAWAGCLPGTLLRAPALLCVWALCVPATGLLRSCVLSLLGSALARLAPSLVTSGRGRRGRPLLPAGNPGRPSPRKWNFMKNRRVSIAGSARTSRCH